MTSDSFTCTQAVTDDNLFTEFVEPGSTGYCEIVEDDCSDSDMEISSDSVADICLGESDSSYGLRFRCPLNSLQSFHAVVSFPPDMLHDILEGKYIVQIILLEYIPPS